MDKWLSKKAVLVFILFLTWMFLTPMGNYKTVHAAKVQSVKKVSIKIGNKTVTKNTYQLKKGMTKQLKITVNPKKAVQSIKYQSGNKKVVAVSSKGKLTAKKKGIAKITVTVTGKDKKKKSAWVKAKVLDASSTSEASEDEETTTEQKEDTMYQIQIEANGKTFSAKLYKNETTEALMKKLPMTINMSELNGNEKYYYFSDSLPTDAKKPSRINTGDIMLYGDDCLVLFYKSFSTSYSYTSLGYVEDVDGLAKALGSGSVEVTFQ